VTSASSDGPAFKAQYQAVLDSRQGQFEKHFVDATLVSLHQAAHSRLLDVEKLYSKVSGRREAQIFDLATSLFADGLCQIACANYRLAFYCLRSFLELSSAAIKFSGHELELRQWQQGGRDILWGALNNDETGVYSAIFTSAFYPALKKETKHYSGLAARTYRECSEYVHGNPKTHGSNEIEIERSKSWFELADAAVTCIIFIFFVRYHSEVGASFASDVDVSSILQSELGHFEGLTSAIESGVTL